MADTTLPRIAYVIVNDITGEVWGVGGWLNPVDHPDGQILLFEGPKQALRCFRAHGLDRVLGAEIIEVEQKGRVKL